MAKLKIHEADPAPAVGPDGLGDAPGHLGDVAAEAWARVAREAPVGLLTKSDRLVVEVYAQSYALWLKCRETIDDEGIVLTTLTERGEVHKAHPLLPTSNQIAKQMAAILHNLGMTPAGRAAMSLDRKPEDPLVAFAASRRSEVPPPAEPEKPKRGRKGPPGPA